VKKFHTPGWVTSLSWGPRDENRDILAVRSERNCISILDLTPIHLTDHRLPSRQGSESSLSWSRGGQFIARAVGCSVVIATPSQSFREVASFDLRQGMVQRVAFCRAEDKQDLIAVAGVDGHLMVFRLKDEEPNIAIEKIHSLFVEANLKALAWSPDGTLLAAGGKDKLLHIFSASDMKRKIQPVDLGARVWDIHFMPQTVSHDSSFIAVALGDYTTVVLDESFKPTLQVARSRTMRCLKYHPTLPLLAMGDGAGTVAIVDYENQEVVHELEIGGRVNVVDFSPIGDYLVVGTDDCHFTIHETLEYRCVQEINCEGFALSAAFSPDGLHLAIGSADESAMVRLGPFLGIDLVPLPWKGLAEGLPSWARNEVMYRSGYGPSLVQRLMGKGGTDNLQQVAAILQEHPDAVYAFDRETGHGCFNTALMLKKPNLLKLAVTKLVDGTLDSSEDGQRSLLTTRIPEQGRTTLAYLIENYPSDFVVDIFNEMTFMKVPFAGPHGIAIESQKHLERGSDSYLDPWSSSLAPAKSLQKTWSFSEVIANTREDITRTPAVLPIPGQCYEWNPG
jgi:WD40 repeat protein